MWFTRAFAVRLAPRATSLAPARILGLCARLIQQRELDVTFGCASHIKGLHRPHFDLAVLSVINCKRRTIVRVGVRSQAGCRRGSATSSLQLPKESGPRTPASATIPRAAMARSPDRSSARGRGARGLAPLAPAARGWRALLTWRALDELGTVYRASARTRTSRGGKVFLRVTRARSAVLARECGARTSSPPAEE